MGVHRSDVNDRFVYSFDCAEPAHGHVRRDRSEATFWLAPVGLVWNRRFTASELNDVRRIIVENEPSILEAWHDTAATSDARVRHVDVSDDVITAHLLDGRVISVPLAWSWCLSDATSAQRANWQSIGGGHGIHWPDVDEDISAEGMLSGTPAPRDLPADAGVDEAIERLVFLARLEAGLQQLDRGEGVSHEEVKRRFLS